MKKNIAKSLLCTGLLVVLVACGGNKFNIAINENIEAEYGEELDTASLFNAEKSDKDITVKEVKGFDNKKIGEQEITVTFALGEDTQDQKIKVNVKDTKAPEITFKSETVEITLGDEIDTVSNIESVKDPVDGDITQSTDNTISKDGYYVTADIKSEAGEYTVTVTAYDKNGNKTEKSYRLVIKEKSQETASTSLSQGTQSYQAPAQSNQSSGSNTGGAIAEQPTPEPSQPKFVCPNGNEPIDPSLPCDAWYSGGYDTCYRDESGNIVVFPTAEAAYDWADAQLMNPDINENFQKKYGYSSFITSPIGKNDNTHYHGVVFMK